MLTIKLKKVFLDKDRFQVESVEREPKVFWSWWHENKPDYRNKTVMLNCYRWKIEWVGR